MIGSLLAALREAQAAIAAAENIQVSERAVARKLARDLDEAIVRLEGRQPDKDLVSIICHDLKDPLASIVMGAGFLKKTMPGDDGPPRRVVEAIARSADRMSRVVSDFHDLAKLDLGLLAIEPRPCDITAVLRGVIVSFAAQAQERGVTLRFDAPSGPIIVLADPGRLAQIVSNLVSNAVRFTSAEGTIVVRIAEALEPGGERRVRISVTDTGRGIAADRLSHLFEHAANARRTPRDGPGLGLPIARALVELHGGEVTVESALGEGSTFWFTLARSEP